MALRNILILLVAIGAAGLTAFYANSWLSAERAAMRAGAPVEQKVSPTTEILVADKELTAGQFVRIDHLKWQPWPEDALNDQYALKAERKMEEFVGTVVRNLITPGQPITDRLVVHPGDRGFLAAVLEPGGRAVSVPVNATSGISGFIFPGDKVDLLLTSRFSRKNAAGEEKERYVTRTLLTALRVLAIDQKTENKVGEVNTAKTVTLEVTPKQAEKVAIGLAMGTLSLSLQSLAKSEKIPAKVTDASGKSKKKPDYTLDTEVNSLINGNPAQKKQKGSKVTVLRGDKAE